MSDSTFYLCCASHARNITDENANADILPSLPLPVPKHTALAAERPALTLHRNIVTDALEGLDRALDALSDRPNDIIIDLTPNHDRPTPVLRGALEESNDWTTPGDALIRYATESGAAIFNAPARLLSPKVCAKLYDVFIALDEEAASQISRPE